MGSATTTFQRYAPRPLFDRAAMRATARRLGWLDPARPPAAVALLRPGLRAVPPSDAPATVRPAATPAKAPVSRPAARATPASALPSPPAPPAPRTAPVDPGVVPRRPMRLAEYLFHRGKVSWTEVSQALTWQRAQRPLVGRIALEWGQLTHAEISELLARRGAERAYDVPFCEYARRQGYLTGAQATAIVGQQRRLQRRIGEWFVARGLVDPGEVDRLACELALHNARARRAHGT